MLCVCSRFAKDKSAFQGNDLRYSSYWQADVAYRFYEIVGALGMFNEYGGYQSWGSNTTNGTTGFRCSRLNCVPNVFLARKRSADDGQHISMVQLVVMFGTDPEPDSLARLFHIMTNASTLSAALRLPIVGVDPLGDLTIVLAASPPPPTTIVAMNGPYGDLTATREYILNLMDGGGDGVTAVLNPLACPLVSVASPRVQPP